MVSSMTLEAWRWRDSWVLTSRPTGRRRRKLTGQSCVGFEKPQNQLSKKGTSSHASTNSSRNRGGGEFSNPWPYGAIQWNYHNTTMCPSPYLPDLAHFLLLLLQFPVSSRVGGVNVLSRTEHSNVARPQHLKQHWLSALLVCYKEKFLWLKMGVQLPIKH